MIRNQKAFTLVESFAMMATIVVFSFIVAGIMRQKKIWPLDRLDAWLEARKLSEPAAK